MSGTRSPSRRAPATDALIVAHGQPSDPLPAEAALHALATRVSHLLPEFRITSATMANPGELERAIAKLPTHAPVYPLFMTEGWFVKTALAKRIAGYSLRVLPPLGFDTRLPALAAQAALRTIGAAGWCPSDTRILLAAHGSARGDAAARSAQLFARRLATALPSVTLTTGFIEQAPFLADAAVGLTSQRADRLLCLPFFAMAGEHVRDDIPDALRGAGFNGPVLPPFSQYSGIASLIADALRAGLNTRKAA